MDEERKHHVISCLLMLALLLAFPWFLRYGMWVLTR